MGSGDAHDDDAETAGMHETRTTDFAIVMSGEIWAVMEDGETKLNAGDVLIQRGTNHAWSNRSEQPAAVAFVLIGALTSNVDGRIKSGHDKIDRTQNSQEHTHVCQTSPCRPVRPGPPESRCVL
jgi:uncharacterized cupin superfamily protein